MTPSSGEHLIHWNAERLRHRIGTGGTVLRQHTSLCAKQNLIPSRQMLQLQLSATTIDHTQR